MHNNISDKLLKDYLLGKCTPSEIEQLQQWASQSEDNARWLFSMADAYHTRRIAPNIDEARTLRAEQRLVERITAEETDYRRVRRMNMIKYAAAAAIVVVIATVTMVYWKHQAMMLEVTAQAGKVEHVTLPDSSEVWLNSGATIRYPRHFDDDDRTLSLQGEAYFEVRKDPHRPFTVKSEALDVRVLGTVFNMSARKGSDTASVALLEGKVQVRGNHDEGMVTINPNQKVVLTRTAKTMEVSEVYAPLDASWHNSLIPFNNMRIEEIARVLETHYGVEFNIASRLYGQSTYSGEINSVEDIDSVLKNLSYTIHFNYKRNGRTVTLW